MRRTIIRVIVLAAIAVGTTRALAVPTGPVAVRTGARAFGAKAAEATCTSCHSANLSGIPTGINDPSGSIRILGVPAHYAPSAVYTLTVQLAHNWNPMPLDLLRWGFQMQAIQSSTGDSAGIWVLTPNVAPDSFKIVKATGTSIYKNRRYVDQAGYASLLLEHAGGPTHYGEVGQVEWHVKWQAPGADSGKIYFFAAGNSTNGDDQCFQSGDYVFTTAESTTFGASVGVGDDTPFLKLGTYASPNPMTSRTDVHFSLPKGGLADVSIFDLSGRHVRTLVHEFREAGTHLESWNGRDARGALVNNGVYFIRLTDPDHRAITSKVVLSR